MKAAQDAPFSLRFDKGLKPKLVKFANDRPLTLIINRAIAAYINNKPKGTKHNESNK